MEVKPGYKQTEVGVFPTDWDIAQLGNIADVEGGCAFSSKAFLASGTYQVVKMSNLYGGTLDLERSTSFLNELTEQERHYLLRRNHIILTLTGTTGKRDYGYSYMVTHEQNLLLNQRVARVIVPNNSCAGYVSLQLQSPCFLNQFFEVSKGGTGNQTNVGTQDVAAMRIPVPPLPEQRAIATALSDVDELLDGLVRLIAKKRDLKQAAMQQLLTGQTRLPGFHGEWKLMKLGELCDYVDGIVTSGGELGYLEIGDVNVETKSYDVTQKEKLSVRGAVNVPAGTVLISTVRPTRGAIVITKSSLHVSSAFCRVRPVNGLLFHLACQPKFLAYLGENSIGGTYPTCRDETILGYESLLPNDPAEQTAIAEVLTEMDAELAALEQRREKTRALKQAMMQELLTGRTRLVPVSVTNGHKEENEQIP